MWFLVFFLFHLLIYTAIRLEFLLWNWKNLQNLGFSDLLTAFLNGFRFDAAALAMTTGLWFLWLILFSEKRILRLISFVIFGAINFIFILTNGADIELINFTARRFTKASLFLVGEGGTLNLITPYLPLAFFTFLLCGLYVVGLFWFWKRHPKPTPWLKKTSSFFIVLVLGVILSRGGLQHKPLTFVDSHLFTSSYANNLVLNSTFTFLKSYTKPTLERVHYFDRDKMLKWLNTEKPSAFVPPKNPTQPNIVIVLVESFSKEYFDLNAPERTPFLRELAKKGLYFSNFYANSRRSIEGVAAILAGIPSLMEEPFINSEFAANEFIGLGSILNSHGYTTNFFHGAKNGSMHFDRFAKSAGITNYYGASEYPNSADNDGVWGIFDEPFLKWTCQKMTQMKSPFFSTIFTLTSHQPFQVPKEFENRFSDDPKNPILKTLQYTDYAIQQFMDCASQQSWYQNTIFIFTADHTGPELQTNPSFAHLFQIPLIIFTPPHSQYFSAFEKMDTKQYSQHIDLLPTLLETLQIPEKQRSYLGRSLWQSGEKIIPLYSDNHYELVGDVRNNDEQLKAVRQYFSEGLFDNRLYYPVSH